MRDLSDVIEGKGLYFNWSVSNKKLKQTRERDDLRLVGFTLPAGKTCPEAGICSQYCYGKSGRFVQKQVIGPHEQNLRKVKYQLHKGWICLSSKLMQDIGKIERAGFDGVRIHVAGDFFSNDYLKAWVAAVDTTRMQCYAYTKSLKVISRFDWGWWPDNLVIIQSQGGSNDHLIDPAKPTAKVVATKEELWEAVDDGWHDGSVSDAPAFYGKDRIVLLYHGPAKREDTIHKLLTTKGRK